MNRTELAWICLSLLALNRSYCLQDRAKLQEGAGGAAGGRGRCSLARAQMNYDECIRWEVNKQKYIGFSYYNY